MAPEKMKKKPVGRYWDPDVERKTVRVQLKVKPSDHARWQQAADAAGLSLNAWIANRCSGVRMKT